MVTGFEFVSVFLCFKIVIFLLKCAFPRICTYMNLFFMIFFRRHNYLLSLQYTCEKIFTLSSIDTSISAIISTRIRFQSFPWNFLLLSRTKIASQAKINIISTDTSHYYQRRKLYTSSQTRSLISMRDVA